MRSKDSLKLVLVFSFWLTLILPGSTQSADKHLTKYQCSCMSNDSVFFHKILFTRIGENKFVLNFNLPTSAPDTLMHLNNKLFVERNGKIEEPEGAMFDLSDNLKINRHLTYSKSGLGRSVDEKKIQNLTDDEFLMTFHFDDLTAHRSSIYSVTINEKIEIPEYSWYDGQTRYRCVVVNPASSDMLSE